MSVHLKEEETELAINHLENAEKELEDRFDRHLALHKAKENEEENENVKETKD